MDLSVACAMYTYTYGWVCPHYKAEEGFVLMRARTYCEFRNASADN